MHLSKKYLTKLEHGGNSNDNDHLLIFARVLIWDICILFMKSASASVPSPLPEGSVTSWAGVWIMLIAQALSGYW